MAGEVQGFHLNGHDTAEAVSDTATDEEIKAVQKKLGDLTRGESPLLSMTKNDISLLKQMLHAPDNSDDFTRIVQICDFLDEDEANRELEAFYEAVRLGMNTQYNISHALSRSSINRKGAHRNSRVAALLDALSHQKFTSNAPRSANGSKNPNSPLG